MKCFSYFLFLTFLLSCNDFDYVDPYYISPELQEYVDNFYKEASARNCPVRDYKLEVLIQDLDDYNALGICWDGGVVAIDRDFLNSHNKTYSLELEAVVFHELGHALLNR